MTLEDYCLAHHRAYLLRTGQIEDGPGLHETASVPAPPEMTHSVDDGFAAFQAESVSQTTSSVDSSSPLVVPDLSAVEQQIVDDTGGRP